MFGHQIQTFKNFSTKCWHAADDTLWDSMWILFVATEMPPKTPALETISVVSFNLAPISQKKVQPTRLHPSCSSSSNNVIRNWILEYLMKQNRKSYFGRCNQSSGRIHWSQAKSEWVTVKVGCVCKKDKRGGPILKRLSSELSFTLFHWTVSRI